ncbi:MAG: extracellular solute-binding protein [Butyrivibrio sp.]|nr:extracellular solute-binding protein [Butyrivibrio sp.]
MKKKVLATLLSAGMVCSALAGCGGSAGSTSTETAASTEAPAAEEAPAANDLAGTTIRFAWWGSQPRHEATTKVVEQFMAETGINVEYEFYDFNGYFTQLDTLAAADDVWDVFQMGNNWAQYHEIIEPLNPYMESGAIDTTDISPAIVQVTQDYDGQQMGLSLGTNCRCLVYNPALFEQAGVAEPTDSWTWDDFKTASEQIIANTDAQYGMDKIEYMDIMTAACAQMGEGYNFFAMDGSDFAFKDDLSGITKMFDIFGGMMKDGSIADPGVQNEITDEQADYICTGKSAMLMIPSNKFVALSEACAANGVTLKLALLPKLTSSSQSGMLVRSSQMVSMAKSSKNKEAAAMLIDYLVNNISANEILNGERGVPANAKVLSALAAKSDEITAQMYEFVNKVGSIPDTKNTTNAEPAAQAEVKATIQTYFERYYAGDFSTAADAAAAFYEEAKQVFANYEG